MKVLVCMNDDHFVAPVLTNYVDCTLSTSDTHKISQMYSNFVLGKKKALGCMKMRNIIATSDAGKPVDAKYNYHQDR